MKYKILTVFLVFFASPAFAESIDLKKELSPNVSKATPEKVESYKDKYGAEITEYKSNGKVWMIKVQPAGNFPPYYLYDNEGDGAFERRISGNKQPSPPMWIIKRF